jgi:hypothetical protein
MTNAKKHGPGSGSPSTFVIRYSTFDIHEYSSSMVPATPGQNEGEASMVSLMAVTNRNAAERIQASLLQHGIRADLQQDDSAQLVSCSPTALVFIHILVQETDLARAKEILQARLEGA